MKAWFVLIVLLLGCSAKAPTRDDLFSAVLERRHLELGRCLRNGVSPNCTTNLTREIGPKSDVPQRLVIFDEWTPLVTAAWLGDPDSVELIARSGANLDALTGRGISAIFYASTGPAVWRSPCRIDPEEVKPPSVWYFWGITQKNHNKFDIKFGTVEDYKKCVRILQQYGADSTLKKLML